MKQMGNVIRLNNYFKGVIQKCLQNLSIQQNLIKQLLHWKNKKKKKKKIKMFMNLKKIRENCLLFKIIFEIKLSKAFISFLKKILKCKKKTSKTLLIFYPISRVKFFKNKWKRMKIIGKKHKLSIKWIFKL